MLGLGITYYCLSLRHAISTWTRASLCVQRGGVTDAQRRSMFADVVVADVAAAGAADVVAAAAAVVVALADNHAHSWPSRVYDLWLCVHIANSVFPSPLFRSVQREEKREGVR